MTESTDAPPASGDMAPIRISGLLLKGVTKDYAVSFSHADGRVRPLSIIAGEISTGKTSTLELIDYCLGASTAPQHEEIVESVRGVSLGIIVREKLAHDVDGEPDDDKKTPATHLLDGISNGAETRVVETRYVLERAFPGSPSPVYLFRGEPGRVELIAPRRLTLDPNSEDSISQFLLEATGLAGLRLKQAPTQEDSKTSILSFRDLAPLYFLTHRRLDNGDLVLEHRPPRHLKLRQVVDYFFGVADDAVSSLAAQIEDLTKKHAETRTGVKALTSFLRDQGVPDAISLESEIDQLEHSLRAAEIQLQAIDDQLRASTDFASDVRRRYSESAADVRRVAAELRERETLHARLAPLRSQYADDVRKLTLLIEARRLFDPLSVTVCPACQSQLKSLPAVVDAVCTLCHSEVPHLVHATLNDANGSSPHTVAPEDGAVELATEKRSVSARLRELTDFMTQVESEAASLRGDLRDRERQASTLQVEFDSLTQTSITPFLSERDARVRHVSQVRTRISEATQRRTLLIGLEEREHEEERLAGSLDTLRRRLRELNETNTSRDSLVSQISQRFNSILHAFGFPKLSNALVDTKLIPHARTGRYDQIGSSGAMTLLSLAWQLAVFELSVEIGEGHPGFLLIDSPQKNLKAASELREWDDSTAASIVDRVYRHIIDWLERNPNSGQIIIVDNSPPGWVNEHVVVRYSGDPNLPPYGLIDDATS